MHTVESKVKSLQIDQIQTVTSRGGEMRVAITPKSVGSKHHILGEVILQPNEEIYEHCHDYGEESLYVEYGGGVLIGDGEQFQLKPGLYVLIPKGVLHRVVNTQSEPLKLIFVSSPLAPSAEVGHRMKDVTQSTRSKCEYVQVGDEVQLFCKWDGIGKSNIPIIFLHGNRDNHTHYYEISSCFSGKHSTLSIDFRGHGLSSKPDCELSAALNSEDIDKVIHHFGFERVILVGHSLGAVTSMVYALNHPEKISSIVLMGAAAHYEMRWKRPPVTEETYSEVIKESNTRAAPFFFLEHYPEVKERVIASWSSIVYKVHKNLINLVHPDLRTSVQKINIPTLVIAGAEDKSTPVESAKWLSENLPQGRLSVVPDTGHFMFMEKPEAVASEIESFLNSN